MRRIIPKFREQRILWGSKFRERPILFGSILFLVLALAVGFYLLLSSGGGARDKNISTPYKPAPRPLATGKQTYLISGSKKGAPKAYEATIDPLDPAQNASQSVTVKVTSLDGPPVSEVAVNMITDNKEKTYPLKLVSGTNLDGSWQGTWTLEDSYDYLYQAAIKAKNAKSEWTVTLSFR